MLEGYALPDIVLENFKLHIHVLKGLNESGNNKEQNSCCRTSWGIFLTCNHLSVWSVGFLPQCTNSEHRTIDNLCISLLQTLIISWKGQFLINEELNAVKRLKMQFKFFTDQWKTSHGMTHTEKKKSPRMGPLCFSLCKLLVQTNTLTW